MRKLPRLMVVMEPGQEIQPAWERALTVVRYALHRPTTATAAVIKVVLPVIGTRRDLRAALDAEEEARLQERSLRDQRRWLREFLARTAPNTAAVDEEVFHTKDPAGDLIRRAEDFQADWLIKSAQEHGVWDALWVTALDRQLLRQSPVPIYVAKGRTWGTAGVLAVALDLSVPRSSSKRRANLRKLREAQRLQRLTRGSIHLIYAVPPIVPPATHGLPGFVPVLGDDGGALLKEACRQALSFAADHRIPAACCHIREGQPDDVIPAVCLEIKPRVLFIGATGRSGLGGALAGNICERISDELECDVVVIAGHGPSPATSPAA